MDYYIPLSFIYVSTYPYPNANVGYGKMMSEHNNVKCIVASDICVYFKKGAQTQKATTWWRHQVETFSALLAICAGNSPIPDEFHTQRPVTRSFDVFLSASE